MLLTDSQESYADQSYFNDIHRFGRTFSERGMTFGETSYIGETLSAEPIWNWKLTKAFLKRYAGSSTLEFTSLLTLVDRDGFSRVLDNSSIEVESISNGERNRQKIQRLAPTDFGYTLSSDDLEKLGDGGQLLLGFSQKLFVQDPITGDISSNYAYADSFNLTDILTGVAASALSSFNYDATDSSYTPVSQRSCSKEELGRVRILEDCNFDGTDLSGINFSAEQNTRLGGSSFRYCNLQGVTFGYPTTGDLSYSQWWSMFTEPQRTPDFSYSDLRGANLYLTTRAKSADFLNATGSSKGAYPTNSPIFDFTNTRDMLVQSEWPRVSEDPSILLNPPHLATYVNIKNLSGSDVALQDIQTHLFKSWSAGNLKPGFDIHLTGTTAWFSGEDISFNLGGNQINVDNPPYASTYVKVNGEKYTDSTGIIRVGDLNLRLTFKGSYEPRVLTGQKQWQIDIL
jgi:hypothetical protein